MRSSSAITMLASSTSRCWTVSSARSSASTTMSRPPSACCSSFASSSWKCVRAVSGTLLPDLPGHVRLGTGVAWVGEDLLGVVELDDTPRAVLLVVQLDGEEGGLVGHPRRLLHVVRDDHDGVLLLELHHQVLDLPGGDRVERRAGLVHQDHIGVDGQAARDAEALLLTAGHAERVCLEAVLDLVPQRTLLERALDDLVHAALHPEHARPEGDVVVDRLGEWVGFLEDHADPLAHLDGVHLRAVEILA